MLILSYADDHSSFQYTTIRTGKQIENGSYSTTQAKKIANCDLLKITDKRMKSKQLLFLGRFYMDMSYFPKDEKCLKKH